VSIDWVTVFAQIINFLVLVWLLQHFLYGPVTRAMDTREQRIKQRIDEAAETKKRAEDQAEKLEAEKLKLEARRDEMISAMRAEVETLRRELEEGLRKQIDERRDAWGREIEEERDAFVAELKKHATEQFFALAREALGGLASKSLNDAIAEGFGDRLSELDKERLHKIRLAARHDDRPAVVESSFSISPPIKRRITSAMHELTSTNKEVDYVTDDEMICGIRLRIGGQTVAWSLESYLDRLEQRARTAVSGYGSGTEKEATR
jgi:F-type H+-transporting ATPase subunit b